MKTRPYLTARFLMGRKEQGFSWTEIRFGHFVRAAPILFGHLEIFMPPKELWEAYSNRTVRPSVSPSVRPSVRPSHFRVRSISPIFFEVGIPNLVCGYILGWRSVAYHFRVTVTLTLTSDLVFIIIVSGSYLLYYLG